METIYRILWSTDNFHSLMSYYMNEMLKKVVPLYLAFAKIPDSATIRSAIYMYGTEIVLCLLSKGVNLWCYFFSHFVFLSVSSPHLWTALRRIHDVAVLNVLQNLISRLGREGGGAQLQNWLVCQARPLLSLVGSWGSHFPLAPPPTSGE